MALRKQKSKGPHSITRSEAEELTESLLRNALREQARDLEKHLRDIDERLRSLETTRRGR